MPRLQPAILARCFWKWKNPASSPTLNRLPWDRYRRNGLLKPFPERKKAVDPGGHDFTQKSRGQTRMRSAHGFGSQSFMMQGQTASDNHNGNIRSALRDRCSPSRDYTPCLFPMNPGCATRIVEIPWDCQGERRRSAHASL